jgi:type II secretory pathway component PulC
VPRGNLGENRIHAAIREQIARDLPEMVQEVEAAFVVDAIVVVGVRQNPFPKKARKLLDAAGLACALDLEKRLAGGELKGPIPR